MILPDRNLWTKIARIRILNTFCVCAVGGDQGAGHQLWAGQGGDPLEPGHGGKDQDHSRLQGGGRHVSRLPG
jgi:hypothetical protein